MSSSTMSRTEWYRPKMKWLKRFALLALVGVAAITLATWRYPVGAVGDALFLLGIVTIAPLLFWLYYVPVMHWRERYRGKRPNIWGAFLVFESSGVSRILYWFVHVLPDQRKAKLYRDAP
jgi:hypothetical protein